MINIKDYKRLEFELHEYLVQLKDMLLLLKSSERFIEKIDEDIELLKTKRFLVAVIGEFKRGKSSLINALLGADILPSDVTPTTATINRITYGSNAEAVLYYKDGKTSKIDINQLSEHVTKLTENSGEQSRKIREAIITYPVEICRNNIEIIDTPGLNDDESMTNVTLDMVSSIDAAIVTISAVSPVSKTEQALIANLIKRDNIGTIIFVVTYIDQIDEEDRDRLFNNIKQRISVETLKLLEEESEATQSKAHRILDDFKLFGISSKMALKAFSMNKHSMMKESGFEEFRSALYQTLISEQGMLAIHKSVKSITGLAEELDRQYARNKEEYQKEFSVAEEIMRKLYQYKSSFLSSLDTGFSNTDLKLSGILNNFMGVENKLIPYFITELSSLNSISELDIAYAIKKGEDACRAYVKKTEEKEIRIKIAEELNEALQLYKNHLDSLLDFLKEHRINVEIFDQLPLYRLNSEDIYKPIHIPEFILALNSFSRNMRLSERNVIHDIKTDVNRSVSVYINNWDLFIRHFRVWCYSKAEQEANIIFEHISKQISERTKDNNHLLQVNDLNYETSKKVSTGILDKLKEIQ